MKKKIFAVVLIVLLFTALAAPAFANAGGCPPAAAVGGADVNNGAAREKGQDAATLSYWNQLLKNPTLTSGGPDDGEGGLGHGMHGDNSAHAYDKQVAHGCVTP